MTSNRFDTSTNKIKDGDAIMDDLLKPVKTVKKVQSNIEKFESLSLNEAKLSAKENHTLKPRPLAPKRPIVEIDTVKEVEPALKISKSHPTSQAISRQDDKDGKLMRPKHHNSSVFLQQSYLEDATASSLSDNAREILRYQPSHEDLLSVLRYLQFGIEGRHDFNIHVTNSKAAQIINVLVTITAPDLWPNLKQKELSEDEAEMKTIIISSLCSVAGIGALLTQIKQLSSPVARDPLFADMIMVLGEVLKGSKVLYKHLQDVRKLYEKETERRFFGQELTALLSGSKILSIVSQAIAMSNTSNEELKPYLWLGNGAEYTAWLAVNVVNAAIKLNGNDGESWKLLSQIVKRGMGLGHRDLFVARIYQSLLLGQRALWTPIRLILRELASYEQKAFFDAVLSDLSQNYLAAVVEPDSRASHDESMQKVVAGAAALIAGIIEDNETLQNHVEGWLAGDYGSSKVIGLLSRRALIASLGHSEVKLKRTLEKSLAKFGDKTQIQHASILQQEATSQTILLIVGCLSRINIQILKSPSISTPVMHAVSNRLSASIPRTRLLGMIVATAISKLVDKKDGVIDFGTDEMEDDNVQSLLGLVSISDNIGSVPDILIKSPRIKKSNVNRPETTSTAKAKRVANPIHTSKIIAIEEVSDTSSSDEDDDLVPYQKPDSDPEDSDEDPTLINRNKPSAPVYIIDLIKQLQMTDKPDITSLALKTAPSLIRRKAGFGTEVSDNVQTLITILINLQDGMFDVEVQRARLESLVSCVVARPDIVGPSLADLYFRGDFSLSQRITILTAIGLGAREIAGFKDDTSVPETDNFPSKRLPAHLQPQSQPQTNAIRNPIALLADTAAQTTIKPMALAAADKMTGPSALKIRTFSSRMEVQKKSQQKNAARTKIIPKNLHKLLTESIFLPLCSRMALLLSNTIGGNPLNTTLLHSSTLRLFLQTLTLVLHTLGPSASLHLPSLSHETLLLLSNLHNIQHLSTDPAILPALLHLLLALLDITIEAGVTAQERLITDYGAQITELVTWSNSLNDQISVPDAGDEGSMPWTVLAAGIQVKWYEIGRKFQSKLLGLTIDEMDQLAGT